MPQLIDVVKITVSRRNDSVAERLREYARYQWMQGKFPKASLQLYVRVKRLRGVIHV